LISTIFSFVIGITCVLTTSTFSLTLTGAMIGTTGVTGVGLILTTSGFLGVVSGLILTFVVRGAFFT